MTSRFRILCVCEILELTPPARAGVESVWLNLRSAIERISDSHREWNQACDHLSNWEIVLLEWATSSGEMRNHQACYCHEDGNKSNLLETMWLGGKVRGNDKTTSTTKVKGMTNGKLVLPIQGLVFDIQCGRDLLHLALTNTMHVPDDTRNCYNYSRVHGP
jgi:hypothetical protein